MTGVLREHSDKHLDRVSSRERERDIEAFFDTAPIIYPEWMQRKLVENAFKLWKDVRPGEVKRTLNMLRLEKARATSDGRNPKAKTGQEGRWLGAIPPFINDVLRQAFNDPHYLWTHPKVIGFIFEVFPEGRYSDHPGPITLNAADYD